MMRRISAALLSVLGFVLSLPATVSAVQFPDALSSIPADCPFVFGINVQQFASSPFFAMFKPEKLPTGQIGNELGKLTEMTGFNPARDISSILVAARSVDKAKPQAVLLLSGQFDREKIAGFLRSGGTAIEIDYSGASIWMFPETKAGSPTSGITVLGTGELALGDMDSLKAVLDTRSGARKSILTNPDMTPVLNLIEFNDMLWIAGNSAGIVKSMPLPVPLGPNRDSFQSIFGSLNFRENVVGAITVTAMDPDSALKTANVLKGLLAYGQLPSNKNPDAQRMLEGITVSQKATQVTLSFNFPGDLIRKAGQAALEKGIAAAMPKSASQNSGRTWKRVTPLPEGVLEPQAAGVKPPVVLEDPLPPYTEEARRANVEGKILLQLIVRKDGTADSFNILQGLGHGLDESAIRTVANRWRFKPGTLDGNPVDVQILIEVAFRLYTRKPDPNTLPAK